MTVPGLDANGQCASKYKQSTATSHYAKCYISHNTATMTEATTIDQCTLPAQLAPWIHLNTKYQRVICKQCARAMSGTQMVKHLSSKHDMKGAINRLRARSFFGQLDGGKQRMKPFDGEAPQLYLHVVDGFMCNGCSFKCTEGGDVLEHITSAYSREHLGLTSKDFQEVRLQSWDNGVETEDFWVVDESKVEAGLDEEVVVEVEENGKSVPMAVVTETGEDLENSLDNEAWIFVG